MSPASVLISKSPSPMKDKVARWAWRPARGKENSPMGSQLDASSQRDGVRLGWKIETSLTQ